MSTDDDEPVAYWWYNFVCLKKTSENRKDDKLYEETGIFVW